MQRRWKDFRVHLIDDLFVLEYFKEREPEFASIYSRISLGAAKADLVRLLLMYEYGGLYLDIMNEPKDDFTDMHLLFEKLDTKTTLIGSWEPANITFQLILSKPKSNLMLCVYQLCKNNLVCQFKKEVVDNEISPYNLVVLTGPILFHELVVNKPFQSWNTYLKCLEYASENYPFFCKWDCELLDVSKYFWLWRVGFDNHHGKNMAKHWSVLQDSQKLFLS